MNYDILSSQIINILVVVGLVSSIVSCITLLIFIFKKDCYRVDLQSIISISISAPIIFLCCHIATTLNENTEKLNKKLDDMKVEVIYLRVQSYDHDNKLKEVINLCR